MSCPTCKKYQAFIQAMVAEFEKYRENKTAQYYKGQCEKILEQNRRAATMKHLYGLILLIGLDNNMSLIPFEEMPTHMDEFDLEKLNDQASELHIDEADLLCCGDEFEANKIVMAKGLQELHTFLNEAFDGYLQDKFFKPV